MTPAPITGSPAIMPRIITTSWWACFSESDWVAAPGAARAARLVSVRDQRTQVRDRADCERHDEAGKPAGGRVSIGIMAP